MGDGRLEGEGKGTVWGEDRVMRRQEEEQAGAGVDRRRTRIRSECFLS